MLKDTGVPVPEIAKKLTIKVGKNAGKSPPRSPRCTGRSLKPRPLRWLRPKHVRIDQSGEPLTADAPAEGSGAFVRLRRGVGAGRG